MFKAESYVGYKLCWPDDLAINSLWAWAGGLGVSQHHGIISSAYGVYRLKAEAKSKPRYIHELVRSVPFQWELIVRSRGIWTSRLQLTDLSFLEIPFPIPPIEEQSAIVRYLNYTNSRIQQYIVAKQKLIKLLEEQKQAIIHQAVTGAIDVTTGKPYPKYKDSGVEWLGMVPEGWAVKPLKFYVEIINDSLPNNTPMEYMFSYLDISSVGTGKLKQAPIKLAFENAPSRARKIVKKGDTIVSTVRTYLKAIYYFSEEVTDTVVSTGFAVLRPKLTSPSEYISLITQSSIFTEQVIQNSVGTAYPAITESKLGRVMVPIPQDTEQVNIIEFAQRKFEDIDKALSRVKIEMELLREYRTRLTADVVTGKVDVRQVAKNLPIENDLIVDEINEDDVEVNEKFEESNEL
jgi:type I restriction enzyme S subunit